MKKLLLLLFISEAVFSQDTIFKKDASVILCKVTKATSSMIFFTENKTGKSIPLSEVLRFTNGAISDETNKDKSTTEITSNCKYSRNEIDEYTKKKIVITEWQTIYYKNWMSDVEALSFCLAYRANGNIFLSIKYQNRAGAVESLALDSKSYIGFVLENDSVIIIKYDGKRQSKTVDVKSYSNAGTYSENTLTGLFDLDKNLQTKLLSAGIKKIRLSLEDTRKEFELQDKFKIGMGGLRFEGEKKYPVNNYFKQTIPCVQ